MMIIIIIICKSGAFLVLNRWWSWLSLLRHLYNTVGGHRSMKNIWEISFKWVASLDVVGMSVVRRMVNLCPSINVQSHAAQDRYIGLAERLSEILIRELTARTPPSAASHATRRTKKNLIRVQIACRWIGFFCRRKSLPTINVNDIRSPIIDENRDYSSVLGVNPAAWLPTLAAKSWVISR